MGFYKKARIQVKQKLSGFFRKEIAGSRLREIARMFMRFDHIASGIINANHSIMLCIA